MENNNFNLNEDTMQNIKNMMDNGDLNSVLSQIPPEMMQNFSQMLGKNGDNHQGNTNENISKNTNENNGSTENKQNNPLDGLNLNNLDMSAMMKMASAFNGSKNKNDPRSNLLNSLKPYLRDGKKSKLDNYSNLLNMAKMADLFKTQNPEKKEKNE